MEEMKIIANDFNRFSHVTDFHKVHKFVKYLDDKNYTKQRCMTLCRQNYQIQFAMYTSVRKAAELGCVEAVDTLISRGFPFDGDWDSIMSPMTAACVNGHLQVVTALVEKHDVQVDRPKKYDFPLLGALKSNQNTFEIVEYLLKAGSSVNATNARGVSPLLSAAEKCSPEVCILLILYGADVNARDKYGKSPLFSALLSGRFDNVTCLLDAGVEVDSRDWHGNTAFQKASSSGNLPLMKLLLSHGADANLPNSRGENPIHVAVFNEDHDVAKFLTVDQGVALDIANHQSNSPFMVALGEGHLEIADMLVKAGYTPFPGEVDFDDDDLILKRDGMSELIEGWKRTINNPRTLHELSIFCIRRTLRGKLSSSVLNLTLPNKLIDAILMR